MTNLISDSFKMNDLKNQINNKISELENNCSVERVSEIEKDLREYLKLDIIGEPQAKQAAWKYSREIANKCKYSSQREQIIKYQFKEISEKIHKTYPTCFEIIRNNFNVDIIPDKEESLSFYRYNLFMKMISYLSEINLIKDLIEETKKTEGINLKRLVLFCFKNTKSISWDKKKELFWNWEQNPIFIFWKKRNPKIFIKNTLLIDPTDIWSKEKTYSNDDPIILLHLITPIDSYLLLKTIPELKKEVMEKETIFLYCQNHTNKLNEKIYCNFWKNTKDKKNLIESILLYEHIDSWNFSIKNSSKSQTNLFEIEKKNRQNIKKNEELVKLMFLIYSVPEVYKNIKELECQEAPDFVITTHDGKKIGLELTGIDSSEEVKEDKEGKNFSTFFSPPNTVRDLYQRVGEKIEKKEKKVEKFDKNWLFLYPKTLKLNSVLGITEITKEEDSYISDIEESCRKIIQTKFKDKFNRIYLMVNLKKIKEINTNDEFKINKELLQETNNLFLD